MKAGKIFLVGEGKNKLVPMVETQYAKEDVLQVMLEKYPYLLPGDQINPDQYKFIIELLTMEARKDF